MPSADRTPQPVAASPAAASSVSPREPRRWPACPSSLKRILRTLTAPNLPIPIKASISMPTRTPWVLRKAPARRSSTSHLAAAATWFRRRGACGDLRQAGRPEPRVGDALRRLERAAALHRACLHRQRRAAGHRRSRIRSANVGGQSQRRANAQSSSGRPQGEASHDVKAMLAAARTPA